ncbi:MAG: hypothetical protein ACXQS5_06285 [Candidatus Methanospirareceae archaeon]
MKGMHGINLFSKYAYKRYRDGDGFRGKPSLSMEDLDKIVSGFEYDSQWIYDYEKMMRRRTSDQDFYG